MQFINNFRGIAILMVIFVHAISTVEKGDSLTLFLIGQLLDNCTVLFVVVAGYLFSFQTDDFNYKNFLKAKFTSIIIPYAVISLPAILLYLFDLKPAHWWIDMDWFKAQNPLYQYCYLMFTGAHLGPLWFIPMIIVFYLISPAIIFLKNNHLLVIAFVFSLMPAAYLGRPEFNENIIQASFYFLPAYLLGNVLSQYHYLYTKYQQVSVWFLCTYIIGYLYLCMHYEITTSVDLFFKLTLAIIVMSLCSSFLRSKNKILDMFARLSFFLFFIHGYFTGVIRILNRNITFPDVNLALVLVIFALIILASLSTFICIKLMFNNQSKKWVGV